MVSYLESCTERGRGGREGRTHPCPRRTPLPSWDLTLPSLQREGDGWIVKNPVAGPSKKSRQSRRGGRERGSGRGLGKKRYGKEGGVSGWRMVAWR